MREPMTFSRRLWVTIVPTLAQTLAAIFIAISVLTIAHIQAILPQVGITAEAIAASGDKFHARFDTVLRSPIASNIALMTFWALVGLVAYLVCWGVYNAMIEARNEVTLKTAYTNRGHWKGPFQTLAIKAAAGIGLAILLMTFWTGISTWMAFSAPVISDPSIENLISAAIGVLGFAFQLYAILVFIQLTFTPWYRAQSFTE
ncbi:MAG: hypothetical protein K0S68_746 [Candidatus Saccharibacteria bacterium]|jgi:hypothetical protein|nr:hypothetical protein [Candidatus Saccharibacteria bacterium]